jgi:Mn-dependent DtxR family transcriptional regulator
MATAQMRGTRLQICCRFTVSLSERRGTMSVPGTVDRLEEKCLRAVYELAGRKPIGAISFAKVRRALGHSKGEVEQACDFWANRGILEWTGCNQVALTPVGLRRADHFAKTAWRFHIPF